MTPVSPPTAVQAPAANVSAMSFTINPDGSAVIVWQAFAAGGKLLLASSSKLTPSQAASIIAAGAGALAAAETFMANAIVSGTVPSPSATST
jgi:hypothetical protein